MRARILDRRREIAETIGIPLADDPFLFSHAPDSSIADGPRPSHQPRRRAQHLGIEDKQPATIAAEDEALRLYRGEPTPRPKRQDRSEAQGRDGLCRDRQGTQPQRAVGVPGGCGR